MLSKALGMLNRLGKRKETDGLRLSSKLEQWKLPSEGTDEETRSVGWGAVGAAGWSAGH